jgi:hypothetical protein
MKPKLSKPFERQVALKEAQHNAVQGSLSNNKIPRGSLESLPNSKRLAQHVKLPFLTLPLPEAKNDTCSQKSV